MKDEERANIHSHTAIEGDGGNKIHKIFVSPKVYEGLYAIL